MRGRFESPIVRECDCCELRRALGRRGVILASTSPRRRRILRSCGILAKVVQPTVDEPEPSAKDSRSWVLRWALRKAESVTSGSRRGLIIAADTIVVLKGHAMGKPIDVPDARSMLQRLSGRTHQVITGVAVINPSRGRQASGSVVSHVQFQRLTRNEVETYLRTDEPWDKAGAYALQGHAGTFVAHVHGPIDNVVGLPVHRLAQLIKRVTDR